MAVTLITTTRAQDIQPLGSAGQMAADLWATLRELLLRQLGQDHADLLTEPVANPVRGETDWYGETTAPALAFDALSPADQETAQATVQRLAGDILELAARLRASRSDGERFLATMLELAMQIPNGTCIYVSGGKPLLIAWGHAKAGPTADRVHLSGQLRAAVRPMAILPAPAAPVVAQRSWRVWLAVASVASATLLLCALYVTLRDPFGWYVVDASSCRLAPGQFADLAALRAAEAQETDLRLRLAQLTTDAGARRLQCAPLLAATPPAAVPPPSRDEQRARDRGARRGKVTVILAWDDRNDLDLMILCPDGGRLFYQHRAACGGQLDVDANGDARISTATPVENVFFTEPQPGRYRVVVDPFAMRVSVTTRFRLTIKQEDKPDQVLEGVATNGSRLQEIASFTVGTP